MRAFAFLLVNAWIPTAWAVDPTALPVGAWFDLVACLDAGDDCDAAATALADPAWARYLRGGDPDTLSSDDRLVYDALSCADANPDACDHLADTLSASELPHERFRGAMVRVRACEVGHGSSCYDIGAPVGAGSRAWEALSGGQDWSGPYASTSTAAAPATAKELLGLARKADGKKATPADHLALASGAWRALGSPEGHARAQSAARQVCDDLPGSAACALAEDLGTPTQAFDHRLGPSLRMLEVLCADDDLGTACTTGAALLELGRAQPWGTPLSRWWWRDACNADANLGCKRMDAAFDTPVVTEMDATCEAVRSGGGGDPRTCADVYIIRHFGVGLPKDEALADQIVQDACRRGDGRSCLELADLAWDDDKLTAWSWYNLACDAGDGIGCSASGRMELYGSEGVARNEASAVRRLQKAVDLGVRNAMLHLGNAKVDAMGVSRDLPGGADLYLRACALGDHWSCGNLGALVAWKNSTLTDATGALTLMLIGCRAGDADSCYYLGDAYQRDDDIIPNDAGKAAWAFAEACDMADGDPEDEACIELAEAVDEPVTPTQPPYPNLRPTSRAPTYRPSIEVVEPDGPRPRPGPGPRPSLGAPGLSVTLGAGSARSWTMQRQASSLRLGLLFRRGMLGIGADLDWVSDNRWRPKVARDYWRVTGFVNLRLHIPIWRSFGVALGGGGGVGGYREGPGTFNPVGLSYGAQELLELRFGFRELTFGIRLEQQQLFQASGSPSLDHVTGIHGVLGVSFD